MSDEDLIMQDEEVDRCTDEFVNNHDTDKALMVIKRALQREMILVN